MATLKQITKEFGISDQTVNLIRDTIVEKGSLELPEYEISINYRKIAMKDKVLARLTLKHKARVMLDLQYPYLGFGMRGNKPLVTNVAQIKNQSIVDKQLLQIIGDLGYAK